MRKQVWVWVLVILLLPLPSISQPKRDFGLGVILGEPTGLSFKAWTGGSTAIAGAAAWSFGNTDAFQLHVDYLFWDYIYEDLLPGQRNYDDALAVMRKYPRFGDSSP